ncbi:MULTISPECIES: hypothetical protein [Agrobacterium]|uniref:hypothetical protein n=1 Tax=Agrobacterium TaxID=357 RepID=UPI001C2426C2|nr:MULTISPECIES: hypothetical protein [Agrobacterium]MDA5639332.1 hypothetical protein [Agrobacterium sp. ST15.13.013]MDA6999193.1 hypothetical protein [Agrobacterium salinitolerans]QXC52844.1 hypothetical protein KHC17_27310 [Agrobacterium salinitolerans]
MQNRLCLTCYDTAAGYLKAYHAESTSRPEIVSLALRLIRTPLASEIVKLDEARVLSRLDAADRCEIYVDPDPNSQLLMTLLLTKAHAAGLDCRKIHLRNGPMRWGHVDAGTPPDTVALPVEVADAHIAAATAIWSAYSAPTPEDWLNLSHEVLTHFPGMYRTREALLDDLPRPDTGLGACERLVLESVSAGQCRVGEIAGVFAQSALPLIELPQIVALISSLASSTAPLIEGLNGRLGEGDFADDAHAWDSFRDSHLELTALGRSVLAGETDVVDVRGIDQWWGGTRLKGDSCWRWDDGAHLLILPARM